MNFVSAQHSSSRYAKLPISCLWHYKNGFSVEKESQVTYHNDRKNWFSHSPSEPKSTSDTCNLPRHKIYRHCMHFYPKASSFRKPCNPQKDKKIFCSVCFLHKNTGHKKQHHQQAVTTWVWKVTLTPSFPCGTSYHVS